MRLIELHIHPSKIKFQEKGAENDYNLDDLVQKQFLIITWLNNYQHKGNNNNKCNA
jgi:hypothetical protein